MPHDDISKRRKRGKFGKVMREYGSGELHSGSKSGPLVTDPSQAKAIAASEAGMSRRKRKGGKKRGV